MDVKKEEVKKPQFKRSEMHGGPPSNFFFKKKV